MHSRRFLTAALLAGSALLGGPLTPTAHGQSTWSRTYGGAVSEQGLKDLAWLPGGRLVAAGYTASFGGPTQASWLLNLELATGEVDVQLASTSTFGGFTDGAKIAADGGALFLGRDVLDIFHKHDAWMMRTGPDGQVAWSLGFTRPGNGRHFLFDAAELDDGSWIAVGATGILDEPPQAAWVVRVDAAGNLLWQSEYGAGIVETATSVATTADGGFAVGGVTNSSGAGFDDAWVMKLDAAGDIEWQKTYGGVDAEQVGEIVELAGGGFAVAGATRSLTASGYAPWILVLDETGGLDWHRVVTSDVWGDLEGVAQTSDGELVVIGRVGEPGFPTNDLWTAELARADGEVLRQRAYEGEKGDFGSVVLPLACSGYVLGGTWGWGFSGESIWLQKTDDQGELSECKVVRTTAFAFASPAISVLDGAAVRVPAGPQLEDPGAVTAASQAAISVLCEPGVPVLEVPRAGVPPNPSAFLPGVTSGPVVGQVWDPVVDHTSFVTDAVADFLLVTGGALVPGIPLGPTGTLLCDLTVPPLLLAASAAPGVPFAVQIPSNCALVGFPFCAQGGSVDGGGSAHLANALDATVGAL